AAQVREAKQELYVSIDESEKREYYPLSASQRRLYITQHMEVEGVGYNIRALVRLQGELSLNKTGEICKGLIERHESLRTSFVMIEDEPLQRVHKAEDVPFAVEYFDAGDLGDFGVKGQAPREMDIILRDFERPFDLAMAPLFRAGLIAAGPGCFILMLEMHHIIADCTSMNLFLRDFKALYSEEEPVPLRLQYRDFSQWQKKRNREAQVALARQEAFWLETLSGELPALNLPCDFPRPAVQQFEGSVISFGIGKEETEVLREIAAAENATLSMATLALFNVLLSKTCDQEDILLGIPVAGRRHLDLEEVFGFFLNMLILRNRPLSHKTFKEFLRDVKENTVKAYSNQDYPFEELVDKVRRQTLREPGRNPVFDVVFVWQSLESKWGYIPGKEKESSGLKVTPCYFGNEKAPYDMVFTGVEAENKIDFYINFSTSLFKKETVEKLAEDFTAVLRDILKDREVTLQNISISLDLLTTASTGFEADDGDFGF
ncbi:MAG: non-ribosomal peptide synthetase, partial [bacterium]|nr:non-ribosomal peptide synthetase [bacterium]